MKNKNKNNNKIIVYICYKVYLINNLKIKFLIDIDILESKQVIIDILSRRLRFESYKRVAIFCKIKIKNNIRICRTICTIKKKIIFARLIAKIAITLKKKISFLSIIFFSSLQYLKYISIL